MARIDDRIVDGGIGAIRWTNAVAMTLQVERTGTVAPFAADGQLGDAHTVNASTQGLGMTGVAEEATFADRPPEAQLTGPIITWRHAPGLFGGIPGHRRFHEEAVRLDQIGK